MSVRLRMTAWYTSILAVTLILFSGSIYAIVRYNTFQEVKNRIIEQAKAIDQSKNVTMLQGWDLVIEDEQKIRLEDARILWQLNNYVTDHSSRSAGMRNRGMEFKVPSVQELGTNGIFQSMIDNGNYYLLYEGPIAFQGQIVGVLQLAADTNAENRLMQQMKNILIFGSFVTLAVASTFGLFLAHKSMAPIGKVIKAANGIQTGNDLSVRIDYDGPNDEIGRLIGTLNQMLERTEGFYREIEEAYAAQRRFVSDASHELRTPLTTIRGNVDLLKKMWDQNKDGNSHIDSQKMIEISYEAINDIVGESQRMSRLVNDMLSLARADAGKMMVKEKLPLMPLLDEVVRRAQFLPRQAKWLQGDLSALENAYVIGSKDYLQQMLFIFIENAFKYTPEGEVVIDAIESQGYVGIRIKDTGIGMDRSEIPHIFERFYRADPSRGMTPGTGLGLAIAKWIIDEHQGSVEVFTQQGQGTTFVIWLPVIIND
ncbi:signal transduction histidine kinase [Paenibacillus turicensis]|uniref:histidine kinase n=1 Tax=Paenibacillus turicensis TaxID=160487 RepID=A0ABS4FRR4_9BACL|nr:HAMP domain-containing sensor histidine kinase [Paenibacillus turicensis]MBP1905262.1 signal transduction histidine kinase [Paenibacillus turicensis]